MSKIVFKTLFALLLLSAVMPAEGFAQGFRRKKPTVKQQLVIEQQRADSLASLIEIYRQREQQRQEQSNTGDTEVAAPQEQKSKDFAVEYTPAVADSLAAQLKREQVDEMFDQFFKEYICEPVEVSGDARLDSLYESRLKLLVSPIHLPYNSIVRSYIQRYTQPTGVMQNVLSLAQYYFPMIDEELIKAGLPVELHAMAIIESALRSTAMSRAGAAGLWQFMPTTGRSYGLQINSMVDERFDPVKSTKAACRYMKDLYNMYNDWSLAIAAYNCGPGNVNKALARAGGNPQSFWEVYWYLPSETRGYVPAFIAASYAYAYHQAHNISYVEPPMPLATDTIQVRRLLHFGQVASTIDVTTETLKMLNPQYKLDIIPATTQSYTLILPSNRVTDYIINCDSIYAKDSVYLKEYLNPSTVAKKMAETSIIYYKVKRGDTLGAIARKYRVTVKQLMRWNGIRNANTLREGQRLRIER
ncbi:MAG: transglycosylase SLT domain-containing protein [Alistipes sp.]|nr:transglycosylase SLT domain-containing protein [Alistipes sp.]